MNNVTVRIQKKYRDSVRMRLFVFGTLAGLLVIASAFSRYLTPYDPYLQDLSNVKAAPSALHLLGTDRYGRDMLSRVIAGSRASVFSTLLLVSVITVVGTAVGILCGWRGDFTDTFFMRISDVFLAFPGLVFALAVAGSFGGGLHNAIIALAAISWPKYARIARSQTLARKETTWMRAVKLSGSGTFKIILKHLLPNIMGPVLVTSMLDIGTMMMELAGLSFLGLGVQPPEASWGNILYYAQSISVLSTKLYMWVPAGVVLVLTVLSINFIGDGIRDALDTKMKI